MILLAVLNEANHIPNMVIKSVSLHLYLKLGGVILLLSVSSDSLVLNKQSLQHLSMVMSPISSHEMREVGEFAIEEIKKSSALFDEADFALRDSLCAYFLKHGMVSFVFIVSMG